MKRLKRLTFWGANEDDDSYEAGDLIEVYDLKQRLRCLIRAAKVQRIRFGEIPEASNS